MKQRINQFVSDIGDIVRRIADEAHDSGGAAMVSLAPMAAVIPSAWAIWTATGSIPLALAIETVGFAAAWRGMSRYSRTGRIAWPVGMIGIYVAVVMLLLFGMKVAPTLVDPAATVGDQVTAWATMLLPLLSVVGAFIYATGLQETVDDRKRAEERAEAERRQAAAAEWERRQAEADAELDRELRRAAEMAKIERANLKAASKVSRPVSHELPRPSQDAGATSGGTLPQGKRWDKMIDLWRDNPHMPQRDIARILGVGKSTVHRDKKEMEAAGVIHVNGNGVEVLR